MQEYKKIEWVLVLHKKQSFIYLRYAKFEECNFRSSWESCDKKDKSP